MNTEEPNPIVADVESSNPEILTVEEEEEDNDEDDDVEIHI